MVFAAPESSQNVMINGNEKESSTTGQSGHMRPQTSIMSATSETSTTSNVALFQGMMN